MAFTGFGSGATKFFDDLAADNTRAWWHANKPRYEAEVRAPLEALLVDLAPEFGEAHVFRPNRDTRFSADKSPYKTQAAAVIEDAGSTSSLYLQLSAEGLLLGGGKYYPPKDQLARLRAAIADDGSGAELEKLVDSLRAQGVRVEARDALKTAPRGYSADHPRIELLRMKGLTGFVDHAPGKWLQTTEARDRVVEGWRTIAPLNAWLTSVL